MTVRISPSLAAAPLDQLGRVIQELEKSGADYIHFDLEDGSFVPMMTLGAKMIPELRPFTQLPFDVHLMMVNPEWILPQIIEGGANRVSVHYEACPYPRRTLRQITSLGAAAGLAFNPATPIPDLSYLLPYLAFVEILSTEPEISDCPFLPGVLQKVRAGKLVRELEGVEWVVDGGIDSANIARIVEAGADTAVIGRSVFKDGRISENLSSLRNFAN